VQLVEAYKKYHVPIIAATRVAPEEAYRYGIIEGEKIGDRVYRITNIIEKPKPTQTTSVIASISGYLLYPSIFPVIRSLEPHNGEVFLSEAIAKAARQQEIYALELEGKWYDAGNKLGYLKTIIDFGVTHKEIGEEFKKYLQSLEL
jgi:UTP--glucose-1-phosphate uridylyltransferase